MNIHLSEEAIADAKQAVDWYIDQDAWPAAAALHLEIGNALARIVTEPGLGTPGPEGTRILPVLQWTESAFWRRSAARLQ